MLRWVLVSVLPWVLAWVLARVLAWVHPWVHPPVARVLARVLAWVLARVLAWVLAWVLPRVRWVLARVLPRLPRVLAVGAQVGNSNTAWVFLRVTRRNSGGCLGGWSAACKIEGGKWGGAQGSPMQELSVGTVYPN